MGAKNRQHWQDPVWRRKHQDIYSTSFAAWSPEEIDIIRKNAGSYSSVDIAEKVTVLRRQYDLPRRTRFAVQAKARELGISLHFGQVYAMRHTQAVLGVTNTTLKRWQEHGLLHARPWGDYVVYDETELIRLVTETAWLVNVQRIKPGTIRRAAEVANRRDPWFRPVEIARLLSCRPSEVRRCLDKGQIEFFRRPGYGQPYMIRASSIPRIREVLDEYKAQQRRSPIFRPVAA